MTRTILAAATAFLAALTLMADQARACISCEYTPEVVRENLSSRPAGKSRVVARAAVFHQRRAAKPQIAQPRRPVMKKINVAKAVTPTVVAKARTQDVAARPQEITTGSIEPTAATADTPANGAAASQTSTVLLSQQTRTAEAAPAKPVGCKKFLPAVGVTVDCK